MIVLSSDLSSQAPLHCDVCVIGAGAVGIPLALALARAGLDVIVAEAGDRKANAAIQDSYAGRVVEERLHRPLIDYRERRCPSSKHLAQSWRRSNGERASSGVIF